MADTVRRRMRIVAALAAWASVAAVAFVTLCPIKFRPETGHPGLERFAAFLVVGLLFGLAYPARRLWVAALLVLAAFGLEASQALSPSRDPRLADALVKSFGGLFGVWIASRADPAKPEDRPA